MAGFHDGIRALKRINPLVGIDMAAKFKKFFLALVTVALGAMSSGAMAQSQTALVNGTSYDFTYFYGSYNDNITLLQSQPWWGDSATAVAFASALGWSLGGPNGGGPPWFAYAVPYNVSVASSFGANENLIPVTQSPAYATVTVNSAAVPEIDGALIPQVGLLLAGLFIILGRRKESAEPVLAA